MKGRAISIEASTCWLHTGLAAFLLSACASLLAGPIHAEEAASKGVADAEATERITYIQEALDDGQTPAAIWQWGWTGFHAAVLGYSGVTARSEWDRRDIRAANLGLALKNAVATSMGLLRPMVAWKASDEMRRIPGSTPEERREKLAEAERWLQMSGNDADRRRSLIPTFLASSIANLAVAGAQYAYLRQVDHGERASKMDNDAYTMGVTGFRASDWH